MSNEPSDAVVVVVTVLEKGALAIKIIDWNRGKRMVKLKARQVEIFVVVIRISMDPE
jgi:hypothetical protein